LTKIIKELIYSVFRLSAVLVVSGMERSGFPETLCLNTNNKRYNSLLYMLKKRIKFINDNIKASFWTKNLLNLMVLSPSDKPVRSLKYNSFLEISLQDFGKSAPLHSRNK